MGNQVGGRSAGVGADNEGSGGCDHRHISQPRNATWCGHGGGVVWFQLQCTSSYEMWEEDAKGRFDGKVMRIITAMMRLAPNAIIALRPFSHESLTQTASAMSMTQTKSLL